MFGCRRGPGWVDANEGPGPKLGGDPFWGIADLASRHSTEWAELRRRELSYRPPPRSDTGYSDTVDLNWVHLTVEMTGHLIIVLVWSRDSRQHQINMQECELCYLTEGRREGYFWHGIQTECCLFVVNVSLVHLCEENTTFWIRRVRARARVKLRELHVMSLRRESVWRFDSVKWNYTWLCHRKLSHRMTV